MSIYTQQMQQRAGMRWQRWQDWVVALLGIWLFIAPWIYGVAATAPIATAYRSAWDSWIVGAIFFVMAVASLAAPQQFFSRVINVVAAVWLFVAPWVLGFVTHANPVAWNAWVLAIVVFVCEVWVLAATDYFGGMAARGGMAPTA